MNTYNNKKIKQLFDNRYISVVYLRHVKTVDDHTELHFGHLYLNNYNVSESDLVKTDYDALLKIYLRMLNVKHKQFTDGLEVPFLASAKHLSDVYNFIILYNIEHGLYDSSYQLNQALIIATAQYLEKMQVIDDTYDLDAVMRVIDLITDFVCGLHDIFEEDDNEE